jgi:hypothetical protein
MKNTIPLIKTTFSLAILLLGLISCNSHRDNDESRITEISELKTDSIKINSDTMIVNSVQSIRTYFTLHSNCEGFYDYQYYKDGMERKVVPYYYKTDGLCTANNKAYYTQFNFAPITSGIYQFKFYNGKDNAGNTLWLQKQIVVQ